MREQKEISNNLKRWGWVLERGDRGLFAFRICSFNWLPHFNNGPCVANRSSHLKRSNILAHLIYHFAYIGNVQRTKIQSANSKLFHPSIYIVAFPVVPAFWSFRLSGRSSFPEHSGFLVVPSLWSFRLSGLQSLIDGEICLEYVVVHPHHTLMPFS